MFARTKLLGALVALVAIAATVRADDWNLFKRSAGSDQPPQCWNLFAAEESVVSEKDTEATGWNLFARSEALAVVSEDAAAVLRRHEGTHVLYFTRENCAPCRAGERELVPLIQKAKWTVHIIRFEQDPDAFEALGIDGVPTFVAVRRGQECGRTVGADRSALCRMLKDANAVQLPIASDGAVAHTEPVTLVPRN